MIPITRLMRWYRKYKEYVLIMKKRNTHQFLGRQYGEASMGVTLISEYQHIPLNME
jgi:hypothetical protein